MTPKGHIRTDDNALRFVEVVVNGPKTWSLAAARHPEVSPLRTEPKTRRPPRSSAGSRRTRPPASPSRAPASSRPSPSRPRSSATTRLARATRTATSTCRSTPASGRPAPGGVSTPSASGTASRRSTGLAYAAVATDPEFPAVLAAHGLTVDPETSEIRLFAPYVGAFSARAAQIRRNVDSPAGRLASSASRPRTGSSDA